MKIVITYPTNSSAGPADLAKSQDKPQYVDLLFEEGRPVALNDERMNLTSLIRALNDAASNHGIADGERVISTAQRAAESIASGTVRVGLFRGHVFVASRSSRFSSYDPSLSTFDMGDLFDGPSATLCDLGAHPVRVWPA